MAKDLSASSFASYLKCQRCSFEVYYRSHAIRPRPRVFTARGEFLHGLSKLTKELRSYWFKTRHTHKNPIYHVLQFFPFCGVGVGMAKKFQHGEMNKCVGLFISWVPAPSCLQSHYGPGTVLLWPLQPATLRISSRRSPRLPQQSLILARHQGGNPWEGEPSP